MIRRETEKLAEVASSQDDKVASLRILKLIEVNQTLTALYLLVEASRWQNSKPEVLERQEEFGTYVFIESDVRRMLILVHLAYLQPSLLLVLTQMIAKLRWEETSYIPLPRVRLQDWRFQYHRLSHCFQGPTPILENKPSAVRGHT